MIYEPSHQSLYFSQKRADIASINCKRARQLIILQAFLLEVILCLAFFQKLEKRMTLSIPLVVQYKCYKLDCKRFLVSIKVFTELYKRLNEFFIFKVIVVFHLYSSLKTIDHKLSSFSKLTSNKIICNSMVFQLLLYV